jgi:hypothetical protein
MSVDVEWRVLAAGNWRNEKKTPVAVLLSPSQISYYLPRDRTWVSALRDRQLTARKASNVRWSHGNPESVYPMFMLTFRKRSISSCWMPRSKFVIICYELCCCLWATFLHLRAVKAVFMFFFSLLLDIPYDCFHGGSQARIHYPFLISSRPAICPAVCDSFPSLTDIALESYRYRSLSEGWLFLFSWVSTVTHLMENNWK